MGRVVLERLTKDYPTGVRAVADLSLSVNEGELIVLVGPSGCGKTTTLRLIAGLEEPTGGRISIGPRDVTRLPARERDVAMVFQRPALYPHLSVRQNLEFGLRLRQRGLHFWNIRSRRCARSDWNKQIQETARMLGVQELLNRRPGELSGGQQQRVALGRAVVRRPQVFLLDEPLSQLDSPRRAELRHELHLLQRRLGATMIYVTHDQAEAMTLADRLVVLDRGIVQQVGEPQAVYQNPANRFVAGFLGWPSMNFLDGEFSVVAGQVVFRTGEWTLPPPKDTNRIQAGHAVTLGIRAEDVRLAAADDPGPLVQADVILIEAVGPASLVTMRCNGGKITARVPNGVDIQTGRTVEVCLLMEHAHVFDRSTGMALNSSRPAG
jgi:multiple sugar transport system ATP-binding protein